MPPDFRNKQSRLAGSVGEKYGVVSEESDSVFTAVLAPLTGAFSRITF